MLFSLFIFIFIAHTKELVPVFSLGLEARVCLSRMCHAHKNVISQS